MNKQGLYIAAGMLIGFIAVYFILSSAITANLQGNINQGFLGRAGPAITASGTPQLTSSAAGGRVETFQLLEAMIDDRLALGNRLDIQTASTTWDPVSLGGDIGGAVSTTSVATTTVAIPGAIPGDLVFVGFGRNVDPLQSFAYVNATNTVMIGLNNASTTGNNFGANAIDLDGMDVFVRVIKVGSFINVKDTSFRTATSSESNQ